MNDSILSFYWNNSKSYLKISSGNLYLDIDSKKHSIPLSNMVSIKLDSKKKLAPLIIGAVTTSLALVNILIEGAGLTMIGLLSSGLLILYFGLSNYWVINIEQYTKGEAIWISKIKCPQFPQSLINIIDFKTSKGFFPPFFGYVKKERVNSVISNSSVCEKLDKPIKYYLVPPKADLAYVLIKIDITNLKMPLEFVLNCPYLAEGKFKINNDALMNIEA